MAHDTTAVMKNDKHFFAFGAIHERGCSRAMKKKMTKETTKKTGSNKRVGGILQADWLEELTTDVDKLERDHHHSKVMRMAFENSHFSLRAGITTILGSGETESSSPSREERERETECEFQVVPA